MISLIAFFPALTAALPVERFAHLILTVHERQVLLDSSVFRRNFEPREERAPDAPPPVRGPHWRWDDGWKAIWRVGANMTAG